MPLDPTNGSGILTMLLEARFNIGMAATSMTSYILSMTCVSYEVMVRQRMYWMKCERMPSRGLSKPQRRKVMVCLSHTHVMVGVTGVGKGGGSQNVVNTLFRVKKRFG